MIAEQLQRTAEWFTARKGRLTGSQIGAALGLSPFQTPDDVMRAMVRDYHGAESEFQGNIATDYGNKYEPQALECFKRKTLLDVKEVGFLPLGDRFGASPDGITDDGAILELKCPFGLRDKPDAPFKNILAGELPHYYAQCQMEMMAAKVEKAYFVQYVPPIGDVFDENYTPEQIDIVAFAIDTDWIAEWMPKAEAFYDRFLQEINNPAHLEPLRVEIHTHQTDAMCARIDELDVAIKTLQDERKGMIESLVKLADGKDALISGRNLTKVVRKGNINYSKAISKLVPDLDASELEQYRGKESTSWRFS